MNDAVPAVRARELCVWRGSHPTQRRRVLVNVDLTVRQGERIALVGPNGAGKTSLLLALIGATPFDGQVEICGVPLTQNTLREVRQRIGFVFSEPADQLFSRTAREEVAFGLERQACDRAAIAARVAAALSDVGLTDAADRPPATLSLGEQRRLAMATVLALRPPLVLIDEPTANLDPRARRAMLDILAASPATLVLATHDLDAVLDLGADAVLLRDGGVLHRGPAEQVLTDPQLLDQGGLALPLGVAGRSPGRT